MSKQIENYLEELRKELKDSDQAVINDALADAEEHLRTALAEKQAEQPEVDQDTLIGNIITEYGTAEEIAREYHKVEDYTTPALAKNIAPRSNNPLIRFFGVYADPRAWGALLYMFISLITGSLYFSWAVTGLSLSLSLALFIFGLPFTVLFVHSIRGVALVEGRIVEALLGERMPRRRAFAPIDMKLMDQLKFYLTAKSTWLTLIYMLLMLVLGVFYFTVFVTLLALGLSFIAFPIVNIFIELPIMIRGDIIMHLTMAQSVLMFISGVLLTTITMHLAKGLGFVQSKIAKFMLVTD